MAREGTETRAVASCNAGGSGGWGTHYADRTDFSGLQPFKDLENKKQKTKKIQTQTKNCFCQGICTRAATPILDHRKSYKKPPHGCLQLVTPALQNTVEGSREIPTGYYQMPTTCQGGQDPHLLRKMDKKQLQFVLRSRGWQCLLQVMIK